MKQFYFGCVLLVMALLLLFFSLLVQGPAYYYVVSLAIGLMGFFIVKDAEY